MLYEDRNVDGIGIPKEVDLIIKQSGLDFWGIYRIFGKYPCWILYLGHPNKPKNYEVFVCRDKNDDRVYIFYEMDSDFRAITKTRLDFIHLDNLIVFLNSLSNV